MSKIKAILLALCLYGFSNSGFTKKLTVYSCSNHRMAETCEEGCTKTKSPTGGVLTFDFLTDTRAGSVMLRAYDGSERPYGSEVLKNCSIFDAENWDCSDEPYMDLARLHYNVKRMVKGRYVQSRYNTFNADTALGACAK